MTTLIHADIFFFVATIGFIIIFAILIVGLWYLVGIMKNVRHISDKLENGVDNISAEAKEFLDDIRGSVLYRMLFSKSRKAKK